MMISMSAIVTAALTRDALVEAIKLIVASISTTAIAITYPRIGLVVSISPMFTFHLPKAVNKKTVCRVFKNYPKNVCLSIVHECLRMIL